MPPSVRELQENLAFEIHWLVYATVRFRTERGRDRVAVQDSAFLHARNLLEFTGPGRPSHGWWVQDLGGVAQGPDSTWRGWSDLINSKVTHLGEGRLKATPWPVPQEDERCVEMSRYFLERLVKSAGEGSDPRMDAAKRIAELGLAYLDSPSRENLKVLADLVG